MDTTLEPLAPLDLVGHVRRHPYRSLLVAAGVGYVLGGGLFTRLTYNVVRAGLRVGALPVLQSQLAGLAVAALGAAQAGSTPIDAQSDGDLPFTTGSAT